MSTFSVVGTPIGNLGDITLRALETLKNADLILCEDTRMTKKLLNHYSITKPTQSYHAQSAISRTEDIVRYIKEGKNLALVSDAGTPGISDPGSHLVSIIRTECADQLKSGELKIEAIPGPSALASALSIAGVSCADFTFLGFLPHKKGRETLFKEIAASERTMVFYESPHRIMKTLDKLVEFDQAPLAHTDGATLDLARNPRSSYTKRITICRELTKIFEEVVQGDAQHVKNYFESNPDKVRGEFVVIVSVAA